jgi:hypothetical protein
MPWRNNPALELSETKEGQYSYDNDHQAHNVDDIVHRFGSLTVLKEKQPVIRRLVPGTSWIDRPFRRAAVA